MLEAYEDPNKEKGAINEIRNKEKTPITHHKVLETTNIRTKKRRRLVAPILLYEKHIL